ncbi:hypothetical protein P5V15_011944 [Pogonomyrmex californicus]
MKSIKQLAFCMTCFLCIVVTIETARILAIMPLPFYSHQVAYRAIWTTLSQRGHDVVLITTDPINDPSLTNLTEINVHSTYKILRKIDSVKIMELSFMNMLRTQVWPACLEISEMVYKHPEVRQIYVSNSDQQFDVVIVEIILTPSFYGLAHRFNAPLIGISSLELFNNNYYLLGAPVLPSHPSAWEMRLDTGFNLSLWQRIRNFILQWYHIYCVLYYYYPKHQAIAEKYLGNDIPDISDMERNISIVFENQQEVLSFSRPKTPNVISFGNIHISKKLMALPKDLMEFITNAPNGFIYMSLGTNVMMTSFPNNVQQIFRDVFANMPCKVLWKYEGELINKPDNVYIAKWFPQQSVLAHSNIKLFIYQGGLQSTEEAIYYKVPVLGLPVISDQYIQLKKVELLGIGKRLNIINMSKEYLNNSIIDMLTNEKYKKRILEVKALNEDKPYDLLEHVIWWIEFVIRHKGAFHLHTSIANDLWYMKFDIDVIAILSVFIFVILLCGIVVIYKLLKMILTRKKMLVSNEKKMN